MQVVLQAAIFLARWSHQRAKFSFKKWLVASARTHQHHNRYAVLRQLGVTRCARPTRAFARRLLCLLLAHRGGDCTPIASFGKHYGVADLAMRITGRDSPLRSGTEMGSTT